MDWLKIIIHFICGAILGAIIGCGIWMTSDFQSMYAMLIFTLSGALCFGIAAAFFLDSFWEWFKDHWGWFT